MVISIKARKIAALVIVLFVGFLLSLSFVDYGHAGSFFPQDSNESEDSPGPGCALSMPQSYIDSGSLNGWSSVKSKSKNLSNSSGFEDVVYAKPDDWVRYKHCYYPGAQKTGATYVMEAHDDPSNLGYSTNTTINQPLYTLNYLSSQENKVRVNGNIPSDNTPWLHYPNINDKTGEPYPFEFDNGDYKYDANFSRVTSVYGYYGGMNIFNNVSYSGPGNATIIHANNDYHVTNDGSSPIDRVGIFSESHKIVSKNHIKITQDTDHTWPCKYIANSNNCITGYEQIPAHCANAAITSPSVCTNLGFRWVPAQDDLTKPIYGNKDDYTYEGSVCYKNVTCQHPDKKEITVMAERTSGSDSYAPSESSSSVIVPYNYQLTGSVGLEKSVVYAGETATLSNTKIKINKRWNDVTKGEYATDVPYMEAQVVTYIASDPNGNNRVGEYDNNADRNGKVEKKDRRENANGLYPTLPDWEWGYPVGSVNVDDATAGLYFCVVLKYYPTNSGDYTNYTNQFGNEKWGQTGPSCAIIAKRPSFQVWGGNFYSTGTTITSRAVKNNLKGISGREYKAFGVSDGNVFGSWGEYAVMGIGAVKNFSSGAATSDSYRSKNNAAIGYGKYESDPTGGFCKYESPLTFANFSIKSTTAICGVVSDDKAAAGLFGAAPITTSKRSYIDDALGPDTVKNKINSRENSVSKGQTFKLGENLTYDTITSDTGKTIWYVKYRGDGSIYIDSSTIYKGQTYIVDSNSNVTIVGNIKYEGGITTLDEVPKLIIYANSIAIKPGVTWIDGSLIAEKTIDTCGGTKPSDNDYESVCKNQLRINGTIIAEKLALERTYGAGTGKFSSIPAEIINYDSTLVLWSRSKADVSESGGFDVVYTHELAPRY